MSSLSKVISTLDWVYYVYIGFGKYFVTLCRPNREVVDQRKILQC